MIIRYLDPWGRVWGSGLGVESSAPGRTSEPQGSEQPRRSHYLHFLGYRGLGFRDFGPPCRSFVGIAHCHLS